MLYNLYMYNIIMLLHCTTSSPSSSSTTTKIHCTRRDIRLLLLLQQQRSGTEIPQYLLLLFYFLCFTRDPTRAWKLKNRQYFSQTRCGYPMGNTCTTVFVAVADDDGLNGEHTRRKKTKKI